MICIMYVPCLNIIKYTRQQICLCSKLLIFKKSISIAQTGVWFWVSCFLSRSKICKSCSCRLFTERQHVVSWGAILNTSYVYKHWYVNASTKSFNPTSSCWDILMWPTMSSLHLSTVCLHFWRISCCCLLTFWKKMTAVCLQFGSTCVSWTCLLLRCDTFHKCSFTFCRTCWGDTKTTHLPILWILGVFMSSGYGSICTWRKSKKASVMSLI